MSNVVKVIKLKRIKKKNEKSLKIYLKNTNREEITKNTGTAVDMPNPIFDTVKKEAKKKRIELITTNGEHIIGNVTIKGNRRISDEMNDGSKMFVSITDATIVRKGVARQLKHVGLNKARIESFYEVE